MSKFSPRRFKGAAIFLAKALLMIGSVFLFLMTLIYFYREAMFPARGNYVLAFLYACILMTLSTTYECFKIGISRIKELVLSFAIAAGLTNFFTYLILSLIESKLLSPVALIGLTLAQIIYGIVIYTCANKIYFVIFPISSCVFVSSGSEYEQEILNKLRTNRSRVHIHKVINQDAGIEAIQNELNKYNTIMIGDIDAELKNFMIKYCFEKNKSMYILPSVQDIVVNASTEYQFGDTVMFYSKSRSMSIEQLAIKRLMDLAISIVGLILASPIMLIIALLIKLYDGGPVFFKQERYTRNEKVFTLIKFRSMIVDAEKDGAAFTVNNDSRITPIGRFIRATRLDELPQLINILKGDMSFVGPRPERIENVENYSQKMPDFKYRMKVKAGLTGYAQIFGKYNTSCEDKARMDMLYIQNYSLFLDLKIIFYTFKVIFMKESTEGFATSGFENKKTEAEKLPAAEDKAAEKDKRIQLDVNDYIPENLDRKNFAGNN